MKRGRVVLAAATLAAAWLAWHSPRPAPDFAARARVVAANDATADARSTLQHVPATARTAIVAHVLGVRDDSLRGSAIDGTVDLDASGRPVADRALRRLFDYFLTRLGERDLAAIRDDVQAHLRDTLRIETVAQAQVMDWFDAYVRASRAVAALPRSGDLVADAARLRDVHREQLGESLAQEWFGADDDYAAYTAQRLAIAHDITLSAQEKSQRLADLDAAVDPAQLDGLHAATDFQMAVSQSRELDAAGADASTRFAERAALWGEGAAARLAALDQTQSEWTARAAAYARARAALLADTTLPLSARMARIDTLLAPFSEPEQRRLMSLAQAGALPLH